MKPTAALLPAALLVASMAAAQTPPQPSVQLRRAGFDRDTWPVDLNGDGRTDLVGAVTSGTPVVVTAALGRGDGTFHAPVSTGVRAAPIGVGDLDGDGRMDVVVSGVAILPGNGNGTFGAPRAVTGPPAPPDAETQYYRTAHAVVADFNGDGRRDLGLIEGPSFVIHPGNGDFTFGPAMVVGSGDDTTWHPRQAIVADFNGDGRRDVAVVYTFGAIDVFLNGGGLLFTASRIALEHAELWDITAGDVNRDGRADLMVTSSYEGFQSWTPGRIVLLLGNGNGSFQTPRELATGANGSLTVVVGDFNRDGLTDIATGNRGREYWDYMCAPSFQYWDSVSILRGRGDGTFAAPRRFHLDYSTDDLGTFQNTVNALKTSDVNGDGHTDLIVSPRTLLLNAAPAANRPPTLFAGPDQMVRGPHEARLTAEVGDPDQDEVRIEWRDAAGNRIGSTPVICQQFFESTTVTATLTDSLGASVTDSLFVFVPEGELPYMDVTEPDGGETLSTQEPFTIEWAASDDPRLARFDVFSSADDGDTWTAVPGCSNLAASARACRWGAPGPVGTRARIRVVASQNGTMTAFAVSDRFSIVAGPSTSLPDGWSHLDVGAVGAAGGATYNAASGTFTVSGSGADIWNTADEFHYAYVTRHGDFDFTARVRSVEAVHQWTKAGLMIRQHLGASAPYAAVFATPSTVKGISVQARTTEAEMSVEVSRRPVAPPVWLKLMRRGAAMYFAYRVAATDPWTLQRIVGTHQLGALTVGLAVSSHVDGRVATAIFDHVSISDASGWQDQDIGAVGRAGSSDSSDVYRTTVRGSGADIWDRADAFHYRFINWHGNGTITARVLSLDNTHRWAKAGVMIRESTNADSKHVMAIVSPGRGVAMQYRAATGGLSANAALREGAAPRWLRLTRQGDTFTGYTSADGLTWTPLGSTTVAMGAGVLVGLPVTSHDHTALAAAVFDDVVLQR